MTLQTTLKQLRPVLPQPKDYCDAAFIVKVNNAANRLLDSSSKTYCCLEKSPKFLLVNGYQLLVEHLHTTAETEYRPGFGPTVWLVENPSVTPEALVWCPDVVNHMLASMIRHNTTNKRGLRGVTKHSNRYAFRSRKFGIQRFDSELECHRAFVADRMTTLRYYLLQTETPERLKYLLQGKIDYWARQLSKDGYVSKF